VAAYIRSVMVYVYCTIIIILTVILYETETWSLTRKLKNMLKVPENMVVRKKLA